MKNDEYFLKKALKEAEKAYHDGEIPVGAVIVLNDKIIARGHNKRDKSNVVTNHAEIIAIERANKKVKNWRLCDCILYTTLEPCNMCKEVIKNAKISNVIYAASSNCNEKLFEVNYNKITNKKIIDESTEIIQSAFKIIRQKK